MSNSSAFFFLRVCVCACIKSLKTVCPGACGTCCRFLLEPLLSTLKPQAETPNYTLTGTARLEPMCLKFACCRLWDLAGPEGTGP